MLGEADEILSKGFSEEINLILKAIPATCQISFFSATMSLNTIKMTESIMSNPVKNVIKANSLTLLGIKQLFVQCKYDDIKFDYLVQILSTLEFSECIIYMNTGEKAELISGKLNGKGIICTWINTLLPAIERTKLLNEFRSGTSRILVSSDILVRNIDIQPVVGLVINFDLPSNKEQHIERTGRSGAYGSHGVAINLITINEVQSIKDIEQHYNIHITELPDDLSEFVV